MGQKEVMQCLINERQKGINDYYSITEVNNLIKNSRIEPTIRSIRKLYAFGYLDIKIISYFPLQQKYRVKSKYVNNTLKTVANSSEIKECTDNTVKLTNINRI